MFRQLDFRSYFTFLSRNRLYTIVNLFGLSVSLMFVILIADYTLRQFTVDNFHAKADRIRIVGNENHLMSGYYLQKYLTDRYPEIEATCGITVGGWNTADTEAVEAGQERAHARLLFADSTFFRIFDYELKAGDRQQALAARDNAVLTESFAQRLFGSFNPLGQTLRLPDAEETYTVSGVVRDFDRTILPECDMIVRGERATERNPSIDERMSNCASSITFALVREGADLEAKLPDMADYFREFYWPYQGNVYRQATLTPLREAYFSPRAKHSPLRSGSWSFVMILFGVGAVILAFAVVNYINLTVAQSGFRAKEMATRRLAGASQGEVVAKLILESTLLCATAFLVALTLAEAAAPYASELVEARIAVWADITPAVALCYAAGILLLGFVSGIVPAATLARFKPIDIVRGALRRRTKMVYSRVLIAAQNVITVALLASSIAIWLQIRHLIDAPLGYHTADILEVDTPGLHNYANVRRFRDELRRLPAVEAVALCCGTPHNGGNNNTMQYGPDRMVSFQTLIGDSVYFRMLGIERLADHRVPDAWFMNEQALRALEIDAGATHVNMGHDYSQRMVIGGVVRDFQVRSALDGPQAVRMLDVGDFDRWWQPDAEGGMTYTGRYPWSILVKTRGDQRAAYEAIGRIYAEIAPESDFSAAYLEQQIENDYREQRRTLRIVGIFTAVALLISALGLVAMSTYHIRQKEQEVAVRKVFGATRGEVLRRLVAGFMRLVGVAFLIACPVAWWGLDRWLEDYTVRIALSPLIFLAAGLFAAGVALLAVFWQSDRAARANPIDAIKN